MSIDPTPTTRPSTPWPRVTPVWRSDQPDDAALNLEDQLTMFGKELAEDE